VRATFWDAVIITGIYVCIDTKYTKKRYVISAIICLIIAIFIEQRALMEGRWEYLPAMPIVAGMGLSPLVQLPLLCVATYEITAWLSLKFGKQRLQS
ncbi:MAG: hypothetical protein AAB649_01460, partial [Patescibacteria group bacterium]